MCIGMRFANMVTKIAIFELIRNFKFLPSNKTVIPMVLSINSMILSPKDDFINRF
jgi:cytochrome P450